MWIFLVTSFIIAVLLSITVPGIEDEIYIPHIAGDENVSTGTLTSPSPSNTAPTTNTPTTNTPTITPTLSRTPSPTETDVAPVITVLDNHSTYVDRNNILHVVGEARNDTGVNADFVKITVKLFNAQNQLVKTDSNYLRLDVLEADQSSCFDVFVAEAPAWSYYQFETSYSEATSTSLPISILNQSGAYNTTFVDRYDIIGQARNDSNVNTEFVAIVGTLYSSSNKVIACDRTYTNTSILTPGQASNWKLTFFNLPPSSVNNYRLQAEADPL